MHTFRVTRNEDLEVEEDDAENLLAALEKGLQRRRFGPPVRLEVEESIDEHVLDLLVHELGMNPAEVIRVRGPLDLRGLHDIADLDRAELKFPAFLPSTHHLLRGRVPSPVDVFTTLRERDVLLHHPYDSFSTSVQRFIEQAAADPAVLAIKQTLYRTSGDSPIIEALIDAAEAGKQVLVIVEIKARFDERANIKWARKLEQAGCHVVYGLVGLKTHCKLSLVVRDEPDGIRRYAHIGTGNYNPKTARLYEDLGLLTSDAAHHRGHRAPVQQPVRLRPQPSYAPAGRAALGPRRAASSGSSARSSTTARAARAHPVQGQLRRRRGRHRRAVRRLPGRGAVQLLTRGICALRPGVPGLSETIEVRSVLGRFLEHSRIFWFENGGDARGLDRLRGPHAPQPRPPGRGARRRSRPGVGRRGRTRARHCVRRRHRRLGPRPGGDLDRRATDDEGTAADLQEWLIQHDAAAAGPLTRAPTGPTDRQLSRWRRGPGPGRCRPAA